MRTVSLSMGTIMLAIGLLASCATGPPPEEIQRLDRQRQQAAEAQQAMEEAKRQEQARQAQAQGERMAIEQAEQRAAATEKTGNLRGALNDYAGVLRQLEESSPAISATAPAELEAAGQRLRVKILTLAQRLDPPPAPTEEAERHVIRGQMAFKTAKSVEEFNEAAKEFKRATLLAPWWPDPYFNLGLAQAQAGKLDEAVASLKGYVLGAPNAPDVKEVKAKIVELEYTKEQTIRRIQGWQGFYQIEQTDSRYLNHIQQCGTGQYASPSPFHSPLDLSIGPVDMTTHHTSGQLHRSMMKQPWDGTVDETRLVLHAGSPSENFIEITRTSDSLQLQARVRYHFVEMYDTVPCHFWGTYEGPIKKLSDTKPR